MEIRSGTEIRNDAMTDIRLRLDHDDFSRLIAGGIVTKKIEQPTLTRDVMKVIPVRIILADIGWNIMQENISRHVNARVDGKSCATCTGGTYWNNGEVVECQKCKGTGILE
jgi:hypothetical protein